MMWDLRLNIISDFGFREAGVYFPLPFFPPSSIHFLFSFLFSFPFLLLALKGSGIGGKICSPYNWNLDLGLGVR